MQLRALLACLAFFSAAAAAQVQAPAHPLTYSPPPQPPVTQNPLPPPPRVDLYKGEPEKEKLCTREIFAPCPDERTRFCTRKETYRCPGS